MGVGAGWYYDSLDGMVVHQNWLESLANGGFSYFHGPYPTEAAAAAHVGVSGPKSTTNASTGQQVGTAIGQTAQSALFGTGGATGLFSRIAEAAVGIGLLLIGVKALTNVDATGKAKKLVTKGLF